MNNSYKIANFFWNGNLTIYEKSNLLSFLENDFIVKVWSYQNLELPSGVKLCNAEEIVPKKMLEKFTQNFQKSNMSSFSNLFRYELLASNEGWWFDMDCISLVNSKEFELLTLNKDFVLGLENENLIGSSVMFFNNKSIVELLLSEIYKKIDDNNYNFYWGEIGPYLITDVFKKNDLFNKAIEKKYFYKIGPEEFEKYFLPREEIIQNILQDSFVAHLWNEMYRKFLIDKNKLPPKGSFLFEHMQLNKDYINLKQYNSFFYFRFKPIVRILYKLLSRLISLFNNIRD